MKAVAKVILLATVAASGAALDGQGALAQFTPANTGYWGTEIPAKDIDPVLKEAANALGLILIVHDCNHTHSREPSLQLLRTPTTIQHRMVQLSCHGDT